VTRREGFGVFLFGLAPPLRGGGSGLFRGVVFALGEEGFGFGIVAVGLFVDGVGLAVEAGGGDAHGVPFLAQGIDDGGSHEALDVGAGRVVGAELVACPRIEGPGDEGAEDGGLDRRPVALGGIAEHGELGFGKRQGGGFLFEKPAIEPGDLAEEQARVSGAGRHFLPKLADEDGKSLGRSIEFSQETGKSILGEQADVLGEHGEEAALEESGDDLGIVPVALERLGEAGEPVGDVAGDLGGFFRRIERMGIGPDEAEALADLGTPQVGEGDAIVARIGETLVVAAGAGELGKEVDAVADVADDEEGRASLIAGSEVM
jgi:hypothetical protein